MSRKLRPEEIELWQQVARSTQRLDKPITFPSTSVGKKKEQPKPVSKPIEPFDIGATASRPREHVALPADIGTRLDKAPVQMDRKAFSKMKRGKLTPEARIDLHGKTLERAHPLLIRFISNAYRSGSRLVLVITGKGEKDDPHSPAPMRRGVLKRQVPLWLGQPPLAGMVLQVRQAHPSHGGSGAYYVYLRRIR